MRPSEDLDKESLKDALRQVLFDRGIRDRALALAREIEARGTVDALSITVKGCLEMLGS